MPLISETHYFDTRDEAEKEVEKFAKRYGYGYEPRASVIPMDSSNPEGKTKLILSRQSSCD